MKKPGSNPCRILIAEDDPRLLALLTQGLTEHGHTVHTAADGLDALLLAQARAFDVLILDVGLPGRSGFEVATELRAQGCRAAILFLTALDMEEDLVRGLELGADDYMTKPFSFAELLARVATVARRAQVSAAPAAPALALPVHFADLTLYPAERRATRAGIALHLSPNEFVALRVLAEAEGAPTARESLKQKLWGDPAEATDGALDTLISSLRERLAAPGQACSIKTLRGVGYRLVAEGKVARL